MGRGGWKRGIPEQAGVQGSRKPLVGCRGNAFAEEGGGGTKRPPPRRICKINWWPLLTSYKFLVCFLFKLYLLLYAVRVFYIKKTGKKDPV